MKYIFLTGSIIFGLTGFCQGMDALINQHGEGIFKPLVVYDLKFVEITFQPAPDFIKIILVSIGFFCLFLIWQKLKRMGLKKIWNYIPC